MSTNASVFLLNIVGNIESLGFQSCDNVWCKYEFVYGQDWQPITGIDEGISQTAWKGRSSGDRMVVNVPINFAFRSTNPAGWPQLVIQCHGEDLFGNDVIRGYGVCYVPTTPGRHKRRIPAFIPKSSSYFQQFLSWMLSRRPELNNPKTLAHGEGREVITTKSLGFIDLTFEITTKDMRSMGYQVERSSHGSSLSSLATSNVKTREE